MCIRDSHQAHHNGVNNADPIQSGFLISAAIALLLRRRNLPLAGTFSQSVSLSEDRQAVTGTAAQPGRQQYARDQKANTFGERIPVCASRCHEAAVMRWVGQFVPSNAG